MQRIIEPEIMDNATQVTAFHRGRKDYGITGFLDMYEKYVGISKGTIVDLGCGTGEYLFALEEKYPSLSITGYDGSMPMIQIGQQVAESKSSAVRLRHGQFKDITDTADCVTSTNTLHHMHDPSIFWNCASRISNRVFVMDLLRPNSTDIAQHIVETLASDESAQFQTDYYNSLLAAFSLEELLEQIDSTKLKLTVEGDVNFLQVAIIHGILQ